MDDNILIAVKNFIKASLELLKENYHEKPLPDLIEPFRIFTENSWEINYRRSFGNESFLFKNYYNEICTMPETLVLIEEIQQEKGLYLVQASNDDNKIRWINTDLLKLLAQYLNICGSLIYDESILESVYNRIKASWIQEYVKVSVIAPLLCFDSNTDRIQLSEQLVLEPFTLEEKGKIWLENGYISSQEFVACKWKLRYSFERKKSDPYGLTSELINSITRCITALRLLQPGNVGIQAYFEIIEPPCDINAAINGATGTVEMQFSLPFYVKRFSMDEYVHSDENTEKLLLIYKKLSDSSISKKLAALNVGIRRFNYTYSRESVEDKLIDLTICLESIILFGIKDELRYRLSLRGATLLGELENPHQSEKILKALYDVRSKIVHEGKSLIELRDKHGTVFGISFDRFLVETHEICRKVINTNLLQIRKDFGLAEIYNQLDEKIITGIGINVT